MIIKDLEINNYKGISNLKFSPTKINVLVGKNNTGKTSVLESIDLLFHNRHIQRKNMQSFFNIYSNDKNIQISANIDGKKEKIEIREAKEIEIINAFIKDLVKNLLQNLARQTKTNFNEIAVREIEKIAEKYIDEDFRKLILKNAIVLLNKKNEEKIYYWLRGYSVFENVEKLVDKIANNIQKIIPENQKEDYRKALTMASRYTLYSLRGIDNDLETVDDKKTSVIYIKSPMSSLIEESISHRRAEDSERLVKIEKLVKENNLIHNLVRIDFDNVVFSTEVGEKAHSFDFLGDGFKSIIGFLWQLSSDKSKNSIILMDEPENNLHPGYMVQLINFLVDFSKKLDIQFFITTHSKDVLEIMLSDDLQKSEKEYLEKELTILRMDKVKDSITFADVLDYKSAKETVEELLLDLRGV